MNYIKGIRKIIVLSAIGASLVSGFYVYKISQSKPMIDKIVISSSFPDYSQEVLSSDADLIVQGTVKEIGASKWNTPDGKQPSQIQGNDIIYTDVIISVENVLKGTTDGNISVRVYKGDLPESNGVKTIVNENEAKYVQGEKVILFLISDKTHYNKDQSKSHYRTVGGFQGKWSLKADGSITNEKETVTLEALKQKIESNKNKPKKLKENVEGKL